MTGTRASLEEAEADQKGAETGGGRYPHGGTEVFVKLSSGYSTVGGIKPTNAAGLQPLPLDGAAGTSKRRV